MTKLKVFEAFSGYGSQSIALRNLGIDYEVVGISEIDKYAIEAYQVTHKQTKNFGDISKINPKDIPSHDLFTYSFPCFVAGTKVLTNNGYKNIEDIKKNDRVLTHKNRYQKVLKPMVNHATHLYKIESSCTEPLYTTAEHPFYVRKKNGDIFENPDWIKAKDLNTDYYIGIAIDNETTIEEEDETSLWWMIGSFCKKNTELPPNVFHLPPDLLCSFLDGFFHSNFNGNQMQSTCKEMIYGLAECFTKAYHDTYKIEKVENQYQITIMHIPNSFFDGKYMWYPISNIEKQDYDGLVYNMEVENDNSYTVNNIIVHNCQDLSVSGKMNGLIRGKTRSGLLYECEKIIEYHKPKYLLLENVKNLVSSKFKPQFDEWLKYLQSLGYKNYWKILNAKDFGIPQNRERIFVVSILNPSDDYQFPKDIPLETCIADFLEENIDNKYYLTQTIQQSFKPNPIKTKNGIIKLGNSSKNEKSQAGTVIDTNGISMTICAGTHGYAIGHIYDKGLIRRYTPRECFRLMGMKDEDIDKIQKLGISNTQQYKLAGNSIVVNVLEAIFKNLLIT